LAANGGRGLFLACSALNGSIVEAVKAGTVPVLDTAL
jgi:hypothetical protein